MRPTVTKLVFDLELGPLERQLGVAYLADVDLDDGQTLALGDRIELRDEGRYYHAAVVESIEPGRYGKRYRVRIRP